MGVKNRNGANCADQQVFNSNQYQYASNVGTNYSRVKVENIEQTQWIGTVS